MAENKTKATKASVAGYLAAIEDEARRKDCEALAKLMTKATKQQPKMWGPKIVGLGAGDSYPRCNGTGKVDRSAQDCHLLASGLLIRVCFILPGSPAKGP